MKKFYFFVLLACLVSMSLSSCKKDPAEGEDYVITQFSNEPFLGETYISDYNYQAGNQFLLDRYRSESKGACSSFRNGDFIARNLDWFIKDYAVLVVHIDADKKTGRHASVNIVSSNPIISREVIASGRVPDTVNSNGSVITNFRSIFPIFTTDGINDMGLCASTNIVMHEDRVRQDYVPCTGGNDASAAKTSFISLVRLILDNCANCQEAIDLCAGLHVTQAYKPPLDQEDSHIFVSDNNETVILEWYNDHLEYTRFPRTRNFRDEHGMPAIMTNFYNYIGKKYVDDNGAINLEGLLSEHPYAMGVERYETLRSGYDQVNSLETAMNLIKQVNYSKYYNKDNRWYTENGANCVLSGGDWYYPTDISYSEDCYRKADNLLDALYRMYDDGGVMDQDISRYVSLDYQMSNLNAGIASDLWYTELTSVYDIPNKELHIKPQEGWYNNKFYKFTIAGNRK